MKRIIFLIQWITSISFATSQTFEKDLEQVYKNFVNTASISFKIKYVLKETHQSQSRTITETEGRYAKSKGSYISVFDSKATVVTPGEIIMIDNEGKQIKVKKLKTPIPDSPDFMSVLNNQENVEKTEKIKSTDNSTRTYRVYLKNKELTSIKYYDLVINAKTFLIERMSLFYTKGLQPNDEYNVKGNEKPRLDILFSAFKNKETDQVKELQPEFYYVRNNAKLSPTSNYKGYAVNEIN